MKDSRKAGFVLAVVGLSFCFAGCGNKFFDPTQIGRFRPTPAVNVILDSLGVAEETPVAWAEGQEPVPKDVVAVKGDYILQPGDLVRVSIFELFQEGVPLVSDFVVTETGKMSIPEVGVIQAGGLTETQLEEEIKRILSPSILKEPSVTVALLDSQQRTFSILGNGVPRPGRYLIPRYDFRLTDALAMAGGPMQFNVSYVYVSRKEEPTAVPFDTEAGKPTVPDLELIQPESSQRQPLPEAAPLLSAPEGTGLPARQGDIPEPAEPAEQFELEREMLDLIAPSAQSEWPTSRKVIPNPERDAASDRVSTAVSLYGFRLLAPRKTVQKPSLKSQPIVHSPMVLADEGGTALEPPAGQGQEPGRIEWVFRNGKWVPIPVTAGEGPGREPADSGAAGEIEWVFRDGRWIPIQSGEPRPRPPVADRVAREPALPLEDEKLPMELEWEQAIQTRLLKIPADRLLAGDPRYNVVIKPGDAIHVPVDIIGECVITGNVNRSGVINITGRPMTLKMAIAAAGGLGPLAWPKHVEVIRRVGKAKEEIVMVDLDKIAQGEQPDIFIKPHDLINVGTHPTSRWRAILRNAFRAAYGFGFVYDRNFADADFGKGFRLPQWF